MAQGLDKTDFKILRTLQEDGRITNLNLSGKVGLSPAPTLERVKKLEKNGYIQSYHALINEEKLGLGIKAFIQISLARQVDNAIANFRSRIVDIPEVVECYQVTGTADYMLKVIVKDIRSFESLIGEKLSTIEEIGQMHTMVILSTVKESKILPLDYTEE